MKYTVWVDYGAQGWGPTEYDSLEKAIKHESYGSPKRITKDVEYNIKEKGQ